MAKWTINNRENKHSKMIGNMNIGNYENLKMWIFGNMNIWETWTFGKYEHFNIWEYELLGI